MSTHTLPPVEAVILVGGQGSRLRPLTVHTAKPMLPVAGVPFVVHQLVALREAGVRHVVLATSYRAETFEGALGDGEALGLRLEYVTETEPLGTGGAIRNVAERLESGPDDPVIVLNGDILSGHDLAGQLAAHHGADADVTLHLTVVEDARAFGCVPTDGDGRVTAFHEKMPEPVTNQINAGCYIFRRSVIDAIPPRRVVSVERETFPGLLEHGAVVLGYVDPSYWLDLGTPQAYVRGCRDVVLGLVGTKAVTGVPAERLLCDSAYVDPGARVAGGSTVGRKAFVGATAVVEGSVLMEGAFVAEGAIVRGSVVGAGARVGERTVLDEVFVGDGADTGAGNELRGGLRLWCDTVLPDASLRYTPDPAA